MTVCMKSYLPGDVQSKPEYKFMSVRWDNWWKGGSTRFDIFQKKEAMENPHKDNFFK